MQNSKKANPIPMHSSNVRGQSVPCQPNPPSSGSTYGLNLSVDRESGLVHLIGEDYGTRQGEQA
jgi:hypothetical protein